MGWEAQSLLLSPAPPQSCSLDKILPAARGLKSQHGHINQNRSQLGVSRVGAGVREKPNTQIALYDAPQGLEDWGKVTRDTHRECNAVHPGNKLFQSERFLDDTVQNVSVTAYVEHHDSAP